MRTILIGTLALILISGCSSTKDVDTQIDEKLEAYNKVSMELCKQNVKNYHFQSTDNSTSIKYKCGSSYYESHIVLQKSTDSNIGNKFIENFLGNNKLQIKSGLTLDEVINLNKDYIELSPKQDHSVISITSMSSKQISINVRNGYSIKMIGSTGGNKSELIDMHEKTINYLHQFQSFSCEGKPLKIHSIEWYKYAYNMSVARLSCNDKEYNVGNYADDLNLDKFSTEQMLFK